MKKFVTLIVAISAGLMMALPAFADGHIAAAVANPARPDADRARDEGRQPARVLEFMGVKPGMAILDVMAGSGYYTEILSAAVGPDGYVLAQNNAMLMGFAKDGLTSRLDEEGRMDNSELLVAEMNDLELEEGRFDGAFIILGYHDLYLDSERWPKTDIPGLLAELNASLKPGGFVAMIDHAPPAGTVSVRDSGEHRRISRDVVVEDFVAAGFELDAETDFLANPADDGSLGMFDPAIRGKTNRFVLRFVKE